MNGRWRRTAFERIDRKVEAAPDDWSLVDETGPIARIYNVVGGPNEGRWFWTVLIAKDGRPYNGGTGYTDTGREAKEACEALLPPHQQVR